MNDSEKAYQYFVIAVPENEEQAKAYFWARKALQPTLTAPNEWVSVEERLPEKHSEYIVCACDEGEPIDERIWGDTVVVCADYYDGAFTWYEGNTEYDISDIVTHWMPLPAPPDKDNNVPAKTPNEPLTQADIDKMHFDRVWIDYGVDDSGERCGEEGVVLYGKLYAIDTLDGSAFEDLLLDACDGETLDRPSGDYKVYRHPPEGEA